MDTFIDYGVGVMYQPVLFSGQYSDRETSSFENDGVTVHRPGIALNGFRTYDPFVGSYLQIDPLVPQTWSSYTYVGSNPVGKKDTLGLAAQSCQRSASCKGGYDWDSGECSTGWTGQEEFCEPLQEPAGQMGGSGIGGTGVSTHDPNPTGSSVGQNSGRCRREGFVWVGDCDEIRESVLHQHRRLDRLFCANEARQWCKNSANSKCPALGDITGNFNVLAQRNCIEDWEYKNGEDLPVDMWDVVCPPDEFGGHVVDNYDIAACLTACAEGFLLSTPGCSDSIIPIER